MKRETALIALSLIACTTCCIVEDNDTRLQYLGVWFVSQNNGSSGGTEHRTNVPGAGVVLSNFTGLSLVIRLLMADAIRLTSNVQGVRWLYLDLPGAVGRSLHSQYRMEGPRCCAMLAPIPHIIKPSSAPSGASTRAFPTHWPLLTMTLRRDG